MRNKYGAVKTRMDGHTFDSKAEARRYGELKLLEKAGEIEHLTLQPPFPLRVPTPRGRRVAIGTYVGDFQYADHRSRQIVVEDVKGFDTPLSRWKRKHCEIQYGLTIQVIQ